MDFQQQPYGNNHNPNGYPGNYPYYNRDAYRLPAPEPGSSLANAAMVLSIIAVASCLTFMIYPAYALGSVAIVLALLSKGGGSKLCSNAKTSVVIAAAALALNSLIVILIGDFVAFFQSPLD